MGLFSDEKRTYVGTSVSRVIQDATLPNAVKTGVVKAIFNDDGIPENILEGLVGSVGIKAERMYEYAKTAYIHGLPSGQFKSAPEGLVEVSAVLSTLEGISILPDYCHYGPPNKLHIGWKKLMADHGYNPVTNILAPLTVTKGTQVYLENMTVVVPSAQLADYKAGALAQWGLPATAGYTPRRQYQSLTGSLRTPTPVMSDPDATEAYVRVDYIYMGPFVSVDIDPSLQIESFNISLSGYDNSLDYFQAKYTVAGISKYWMYQDNLGTYPTLDAAFATEVSVHGTLFPFVYFRYNHLSEIDDKTTDSYKTSKKLVKYLGMDYDTIASAIDENPDIANVEQAMMIMAVPATTTDPLELRYLFSFFDNMYYMGPNQFTSVKQANISALLNDLTQITENSLIIQDARFKMAVSNAGIFKKRVGGSIGTVGTHTHGTGTISVEETYVQIRETGDTYETRMVDIPYHFYRQQITVGLYDEIQVVNLKTLYYILDGLYATGDETDDILLIPLDRSITSEYSIPERERLYSRSLHYVFNSVTVITLAWYQQSWFAFVMQAIAFAITVISLGTSSSIWIIIQKILASIVIGALFKLVVEAIGIESASILAVIAMAVAIYQGVSAGSLKGAPWATELLQLSSGLSNGIKLEIKGLYGELLEEYQSFNLFKDTATKELEAANKLLEHTNYLSPFVIFGEKPEDYYNRTCHSGNIGVLGIGAISRYVDIALTLPRLDETIEG